MATRTMQDDLGSVLQSIDHPAVPSDASTDPIRPENFKAIGSYNWLEDETPTILVPGAPPVFRTKLEFPFEPSKNVGKTFSDQNSFRVPNDPMAPLVLAVKQIQPNFSFNQVDIVSDLSCVAHLLDWVSGAEEASKEFRIDLELAKGGKTILMNRYETKLVDEKSKGIAANFEREVVEQVGKGNQTGHERIVTYKFLNSVLVLRYPVQASSGVSPTSPAAKTSALPGDETEDSVSDEGTGIKIIRSDNILAAQSSLLALNTISKTAKFSRAHCFNELFLSQIPSMYLSRHNKGAIGAYEDIKLSGMRVEEKKGQEGLKLLGALLDQIKQIVRGKGEGKKLSLLGKKGSLELFERQAAVGLSDELMQNFV